MYIHIHAYKYTCTHILVFKHTCDTYVMTHVSHMCIYVSHTCHVCAHTLKVCLPDSIRECAMTPPHVCFPPVCVCSNTLARRTVHTSGQNANENLDIHTYVSVHHSRKAVWDNPLKYQYMCTCIFICMYMYVHLSIYINAYMCICVCAYRCMYIGIYKYIYMYTYVYICIYIYIHT